MKWIHWTEPRGPLGAPVHCSMKERNVIDMMQKDFPERMYSDQSALDDFIAVNWATKEEKQ